MVQDGPDACCMLLVACCMSHVACCMLHVACCMLHVACCMLKHREASLQLRTGGHGLAVWHGLARGLASGEREWHRVSHAKMSPSQHVLNGPGRTGRMLHVACCLLHVACCMLHVAAREGSLHVACCMLHVACCMLHVACRMSHVAC